MHFFDDPESYRFWTIYRCKKISDFYVVQLVISLAVIAFGAVLIVHSAGQVQLMAEYGDCTAKACSVQFIAPSNYSGSFVLAYRLTNFYQSKRDFMMGKSLAQFDEGVVTLADAAVYCDPFTTNGQMGLNSTFDSREVAYPCGIAAKFIFNDTFSLRVNGNLLPLKTEWAGEQLLKAFRLNSTMKNWTNVHSTAFAEWMRISTLPDFKKVYAHVDLALTAGDIIQVDAVNNYGNFGKSVGKYVVLQSYTGLGGASNWGWFLVVFGIVIALDYMAKRYEKQFETDDQ